MKIVIDNKRDLFLFSDPHYNHGGIVRGTSNWEDKNSCRDFNTLEEHDTTLVNNINETVGEDDTLICLGDWAFGSYKNKDNYNNVIRFREQLACKNIILIEGNHDQEIKKSKELQLLFSEVSPYKEICVIDTRDSGRGVKPVKQNIVLCHYAMRVWNKSHAGSWMLYGHSHGSLDEFTPLTANPTWIGDKYYTKNYRTMDVGIDTHPEFRPYSYKEIREKMEQRNVEIEIDHHASKNKR